MGAHEYGAVGFRRGAGLLCLLPGVHEAMEVSLHPGVELGCHGVHGGFGAIRKLIGVRCLRRKLRFGGRCRNFRSSYWRCGRHLYYARNIRRRHLLGFHGLAALCAKQLANQFLHSRIVLIFGAMLGANP